MNHSSSSMGRLSLTDSLYQKEFDNRVPEGWMFVLLRFPILIVIACILLFELGCYICVRLFVNVQEYMIIWRGKRKDLRIKLRSAQTYDEWMDAANELDQFLDRQSWKNIDESHHFDYRLIRYGIDYLFFKCIIMFFEIHIFIIIEE